MNESARPDQGTIDAIDMKDGTDRNETTIKLVAAQRAVHACNGGTVVGPLGKDAVCSWFLLFDLCTFLDVEQKRAAWKADDMHVKKRKWALCN
jgi:hypothetical protein